MKYFLTLLLGTILLSACSERKNEISSEPKFDPSKEQLFKLGLSTNTVSVPMQFMPVWVFKTLTKIGLKKITIHYKGGKNPQDTLQKNEFNFDWDKKISKFVETGNSPNGKYISEGVYHLIDENHIEIDYKTINTDKKEKKYKTKILNKNKSRIVLRMRGDKLIDSTIFNYVSDKVQTNVLKIGDFVNSVQIFVPENTNKTTIVAIYKSLNLSISNTSTATISVIYTKNKLPTSSYSLNNEFVQIAKEKEWKYDSNYCLTSYAEFYNNTPVKTIKFTYNKNFLPKTMTVNDVISYFDYE